MKLAELASYGMHGKAPEIGDLKGPRRVATLVATVRELEATSVDDALLLFDLLMSTRLLSAAARQGDKEKLRTLPRLRTAAARMAAAWSVVLRHTFGYRLSETSGHNRAELERRLSHANDRYLRLYTNPPDDIAAGYVEDL